MQVVVYVDVIGYGEECGQQDDEGKIFCYQCMYVDGQGCMCFLQGCKWQQEGQCLGVGDFVEMVMLYGWGQQWQYGNGQQNVCEW